MSGASVEWVGINDAQKRLKHKADKVEGELAAVLHDVALRVFEASQLQVPVATGVLRSSGYVVPPQRDERGRMYAEVVYGGAASAYALYVHEDMNAYHAPPTKAKYLEDPLTQIGEPMLEKLADAKIKSFMKK